MLHIPILLWQPREEKYDRLISITFKIIKLPSLFAYSKQHLWKSTGNKILNCLVSDISWTELVYLLFVCMITEGSASSAAGDSGNLSDCFVPGAISNRTLEHLTENNARPQQYRAIRGEHHAVQSYANSQYVQTVTAAMLRI